MNKKAFYPDWPRLYATAQAQAGYVSSKQASMAGYSSQLLQKKLKAGIIQRQRHGIYRLVHFPSSEHEGLVELWLWSKHEGVFSHESALALHGVSDALPAKAIMTLPLTWKKRRIRLPDELLIYYADIKEACKIWHGPIPITTIKQTVQDCIRSKTNPELIEQAISDISARGLLSPSDINKLILRQEIAMEDDG